MSAFTPTAENIRHEMLRALTFALLKAKNATKRTKYRAALFSEMRRANLDHYTIDAKTYLQMTMRERVWCGSICTCGESCGHALIYTPELEVVYDA